jgi:hypothetical protein
MAEHQRTGRRTRDVERAADGDLVLADPERVLLAQPAGDRPTIVTCERRNGFAT